MCGILCILSCNKEQKDRVENSILPVLLHRGPDSHHQCSTSVGETSLTLHLYGTVLHLRGALTPQPLVSSSGHMFLWNGEIFGGDIDVPVEANDTKVLFDQLCSLPLNEANYERHLIALFQSLNGPWAFVFYDAVNRNLWYGRDYFGRRSLLSFVDKETFVISSVGKRSFTDHFKEIPAKTLYRINISKTRDIGLADSIMSYDLFPNNLPPLIISQHRCWSQCNPNEKLNNVVNDAEEICPAITTQDTKHAYCSLSFPNNGISNEKQENSHGQHQMHSIEQIQDEFSKVLLEAVRKRVHNLPRKHVESENSASTKSKIGILFSGGIDSVVITALADLCVPQHESIDLINVAFGQKPKTQQNVKKKHQKSPLSDQALNFDVPDRITGRSALRELSKTRRWNFVEVDVTLEELQKVRESEITNLVYPLDSVLDDSIGCAIWFAARGIGKCYNVQNTGDLELLEENYCSPVKVILTGMGADEQLGGYARHRTKFEALGWEGLGSEMNMELERISSRNLGRDDRCISDHGREARFPFLDENVVAFLKQLPVCVKCDPRLPRGVGEKILLREVALSLGLNYASSLPKRAIQFGSKIAKLEGRKEKGSDNCKRLEQVLKIE